MTWRADFTQLSRDFIVQAKDKSRVELIDSPRTGGKALRLITLPGDNNVAGSGLMERCDVYQFKPKSAAPLVFYAGTEQWWAHSIMFPDDFQFPTGTSYVLWDFHNYPEGQGQANYMVNFVNTWGGNKERLGELQLQRWAGTPTALVEKSVSIGKPARNVWYDFVYHVKWSPFADGFFTAWVNEQLVMDHTGQTLFPGADQGTYMKLANYHTTNGSASSVIHDRVILGSTRESVTQ